MSLAAMGKPPPPTDNEAARLWDGISTFDAETRAIRQARAYSLGTFLSTLEIPEGGLTPVRVEKTRGPGHHTLWGDPGDLLGLVQETKPIPPPVLR